MHSRASRRRSYQVRLVVLSPPAAFHALTTSTLSPLSLTSQRGGQPRQQRRRPSSLQCGRSSSHTSRHTPRPPLCLSWNCAGNPSPPICNGTICESSALQPRFASKDAVAVSWCAAIPSVKATSAHGKCVAARCGLSPVSRCCVVYGRAAVSYIAAPLCRVELRRCMGALMGGASCPSVTASVYTYLPAGPSSTNHQTQPSK